jgi:phospholipase D1/2
MGVVGDCVYDIAEHFVLRWNFVKRDKYKRDGRYDWLLLEGRDGKDEDLIGVQRPKHPVGDYIHHPVTSLSGKNLGDQQGTVHAQIVRSSDDWSSGILKEHSIQNAYIELIQNAQHYVYIENQFFITATGEEQSPIKNQIGKAIVEAVVRASKEGRKFRIICVIPAIPGFAGDLRDDAAMGTRAIMDYQYKSICRGEHSIMEQIRAQGVDPHEHIFFFNLRSFDRLNVTPSLKKAEEETGIKYQDIQRAEAEEIMGEGIHGSKEQGDLVEGDSHMGRRKRGDPRKDDQGDDERAELAEKKERFEEAQGRQETNTTDSVAHAAMHGTGSLVDEKWEGDIKDEVDNWIQEELYIHGKTMIVDDKHVICGSSNINDRSQLGNHDSEIAIVCTDTKPLSSKMDGQSYEAGYHAATLRRYLWREHLGLLPPQQHDANEDPNAQPPDVPNDPQDNETYEQVADPLNDELWEMWTSRATKNTEVFRQLFHADPDDHGMYHSLISRNQILIDYAVKTFDDYDRFLPPKGVKSGHIFDRMIPPEVGPNQGPSRLDALGVLERCRDGREGPTSQRMDREYLHVVGESINRCSMDEGYFFIGVRYSSW